MPFPFTPQGTALYMQLFYRVIVIIIAVLIAIGDIILFIGNKLFIGVRYIEHKVTSIAKQSIRGIIFVLAGTSQFFKKIGAKIVRVLIPRPKRKRKKKKSLVIFPLPVRIKIKYFFIGTIFSLIFIFIPLVILVFLQDLPSPKELTLRQIPQTTKIFDRHNTLLYQIYVQQNRTLVSLSDIPQTLQSATLAIEDKNFYKHPGFDLFSIVRAFRENLSGRSFQGGSTITQQLIKSSILSSEPTLIRKIKEIVLAFWAERIYTKRQILEMYFNQVPYGGTSWGAEAASEVYFGKKVHDLDLAESAFLAGLTAAPSNYSPFSSDPSLWKKRQKEVLNRMIALDFINKHQAAEAEKEDLHFQPQQTAIYAPYFVNYVKDFLVRKYGLPMVERGGLQVITSLDLPLEQRTEQVVADEVAKAAPLNVGNGATVITSPQNGDILAMIGGKDFSNPNGGNVNLATSLRQPGSSIKVVTYSAALSHGFTSATVLDDSPVTYTALNGPSYSPVNYDGKFHGKVPLRFALANSFNIPAVKVLNQIGVPTMVNLGKDLGIKSWGEPNQYGLAITLGGAEVTMLDMAEVYGTFANQGNHIELNPILKITDYKGNVIEEKGIPAKKQVLDPGVVYILSDILADNQARSLEFGPNSPLYIPGHFISVKTGTSDNKRDNWTDGYTSDYVVIVWVGNNDNSPMSQNLASGITGAAPIWNRVMTSLLQKTPEKRPPQPQDVTIKACYGRLEYFIRGTENASYCSGLTNPSISPFLYPSTSFFNRPN